MYVQPLYLHKDVNAVIKVYSKVDKNLIGHEIYEWNHIGTLSDWLMM